MGVTANGSTVFMLNVAKKKLDIFQLRKTYGFSYCLFVKSWCTQISRGVCSHPPSERLEPRNQTLSFQYKMAFVSNNCLKSFVT